MTRLVAFHLLGGAVWKPISKAIIAIDPEPGDSPFDSTRYKFIVCEHYGHSDFLPSDDCEILYEHTSQDLGLEEEVFEECKDFATVREWLRDEAECEGERRHWERIAK